METIMFVKGGCKMEVNDKYEEFQRLNQEKQLEKIKEFNPNLHRVFTSVLRARGDCKDIPDAFSYVKALQEYDKENGIQIESEQYQNVLKQYDGIVEKFKE
jgi:hypothetical protein